MINRDEAWRKFEDMDNWVADDSCLVKQVLKKIKNDQKIAWENLKNQKTTNDWDVQKACVTAVNRKQHVGVYAGDPESYLKLQLLLDAVIYKYHGVKREANVHGKENYDCKVSFPSMPPGAIKSTRIRTARNLQGFPFTCNMTKAQRLEVEAVMKNVFNGFSDPNLKGTYYPLDGMDEETRLKMVDLHWLFINDDETLKMVGTYDDWPCGRGIFVNDNQDKGIFIVWVGEEDQLRIMAMNKGSDVQAVWNLFYSGLQAVHEGVKKFGSEFIYDAQLGYLSSCPTNIGTGMRASVHVDLPKFATKEDAKRFVKSKKLAIDIRGTRGEATDTSGCTVYDVSNKERLGSTCVEQVNAMINGVSQLLNA